MLLNGSLWYGFIIDLNGLGSMSPFCGSSSLFVSNGTQNILVIHVFSSKDINIREKYTKVTYYVGWGEYYIVEQFFTLQK